MRPCACHAVSTARHVLCAYPPSPTATGGSGAGSVMHVSRGAGTAWPVCGQHVQHGRAWRVWCQVPVPPWSVHHRFLWRSSRAGVWCAHVWEFPPDLPALVVMCITAHLGSHTFGFFSRIQLLFKSLLQQSQCACRRRTAMTYRFCDVAAHVMKGHMTIRGSVQQTRAFMSSMRPLLLVMQLTSWAHLWLC